MGEGSLASHGTTRYGGAAMRGRSEGWAWLRGAIGEAHQLLAGARKRACTTPERTTKGA